MIDLMEEREFVRQWFQTVKEENANEGILFPFLISKQLKENRILRAKMIGSSKLHRACFACLTFQNPNASKPKQPYNGVFFSPHMEELEAEGLVEIVWYRVKADVEMYKEDLPNGEYRLYLQVLPNPKALEEFFDRMGAIYVPSKAMLQADVEISF